MQSSHKGYMAQGVSSHLNRSSSGYERSGRQCHYLLCGPESLSWVGTARWPDRLFHSGTVHGKMEDSIAVLVCRNVPEAVLICRSYGCTSFVNCLLHMDPHLLGHALSCSLYISVRRLIAPRSWRLCHPLSLIIISEKLDFYDNRFSHSVQLCTGLSLLLPHQLFR